MSRIPPLARGLAVVLAIAAPAATADPAAPRAGTAAALLGPWLRFYASFDVDALADLAVGRPEPATEQGRVWVVPGAFGGALRLGRAGGGAEISYDASGQLDLTRPGGLSFWVRAGDWSDRGKSGYVRFVRLRGAEQSVFLVERDVRRPGSGGERLLVGFFQLRDGRPRFLTLRAGERWSAEAWHLVVVSWDGTGLAGSLDGAPFQREPVPAAIVEGSFGLAVAGAWTVGDRGAETSDLDELAVYGRSLSDADALRLYRGLNQDSRERAAPKEAVEPELAAVPWPGADTKW